MSIIPITNKCNQKCVFCFAEYRRNNSVLPLNTIFKEIDLAENLIVISGGEPTLSKDLFKIINYAKEKGKKIELQTNGVTLGYFDLAEKLFSAGVDLFNINIPSHKKNLSDKITKTPGFYQKRVKGIKNLEKLLYANIRITHLINSLTYKDLPAFVDWVRKKFISIKYIQFSFIKIFTRVEKNSNSVLASIVPRYEKVEPYLIAALKKCKKYKINFVVDHIPPCFLGPFIDHHIDFIKIKKWGQKEIKQSLKEKVKIKVCFGCNLKNLCCGPRKDYLKTFNNIIFLKPKKK